MPADYRSPVQCRKLHSSTVASVSRSPYQSSPPELEEAAHLPPTRSLRVGFCTIAVKLEIVYKEGGEPV